MYDFMTFDEERIARLDREIVYANLPCFTTGGGLKYDTLFARSGFPVNLNT